MNHSPRLTSAYVVLVLVVAIGAVWFFALRSSHREVTETAEIYVAAAANFADAIEDLAHRFHEESSCRVKLSFGASGSLYAQIKNGAPFAAFFSADVERPQRLEEEGLTVPGSRYTYAVGHLVLWSPQPDYVDPQGDILQKGDFRHLALASPELAPYGRAAEEVLTARGLWERLPNRIVLGENISQTFQFIQSGNAELGFVAYSQVKRGDDTLDGSFWEIPQSLYTPIEQQAVLLTDDAAARAFLQFVRSDEGRDVIRRYGYDTPP